MGDVATRYKPILASEHGGLIDSDSGISLHTHALSHFSNVEIDTLFVTGGLGVFDAAKNIQVVDSLEILVKRVGMSSRNFSRVYSEEFGCSPGKAVEMLRFAKARLLLETTNIPIKSIAIQVGCKDYERIRRTFIRNAGISPIDYRCRFSL